MFQNHPLFTLENLYNAYLGCRKGKRGTLNALKFEQNLEENLINLQDELTTGRYVPGKSVAFLIEKPKRREIFAADFRDRVVHHLLVGYLEPHWESCFIYDSYACRKGKGTHKGVERLQSFTRKVTANGTRRAWYLQLDIRGFFISINRQILYERLTKKERDPVIRRLVRALLFYDPTGKRLKGGARRADFESLPTHKTLSEAASVGRLRIWNLTSQFFSNLYHDALDQFIKHHLKVQYYLRYCDDFVLLSLQKAILERWEAEIREFLLAKLGLTLNSRRRLRPVSDGIDFLGYIVRPNYLLVRKRVVGACFERLTSGERRLIELGLCVEDGICPCDCEAVKAVYNSLNSYLAHFSKSSSYRLVERIRRNFPWLEEYYLWEQKRIKYRIEPLPPVRTIYEQRAEFERRLPGHILLAEMGKWWELWAVCPHPRELTWKRFPESELPTIKKILWESGVPVGWIRETGLRPTTINERELFFRWAGKKNA